MAEPTPGVSDAPTPVTILTGFLGSGKTTLINTLIGMRGARQLAVIENEFGEIGVDGELLTQIEDQLVIQISDGCVCCSVRGDLANALNELVQRRARGEISFDHVILETTGLADPGPIVRTFMAQTAVIEHFYLNGVLCVVDARCGLETVAARPEALAQIAYASRMLVTKSDLADGAILERLRVRLGRINPAAMIESADLQRADGTSLCRFVFEMNGYLFDHVTFAAQVQPASCDHPGEPHGDECGQDDDGDHLGGVVAVSWRSGGLLHAGRIDAVLEALKRRYPSALWRVKGILAVAGARRKLIVQGVQGLIEINPSTLWRPHERKHSTLVLIGDQLDRDEIIRALDACVIPPAPMARG